MNYRPWGNTHESQTPAVQVVQQLTAVGVYPGREYRRKELEWPIVLFTTLIT